MLWPPVAGDGATRRALERIAYAVVAAADQSARVSRVGLAVRVVMFIHGLTAGGAERVTVTLANHWASHDWDVVIVTLLGVQHDAYRLSAGVRRRVLNLGQSSGTPRAALLANARRVAGLRRVLKAERPDGAIAMMPSANVVLALAALGTGVPVRIGSERLHPPLLPLNRPWRLLRGLTYPLLTEVVAQTRESAAWLCAHTLLSPARVAVIANPVDFPLPSSVPEVRLERVRAQAGCACVLLAVGRLEPAKGFDRLVDAFATIAPDYPDWALVILGEGADRGRLEAKVAGYGLDARIRLPGRAGNIGDCYASADAYVLSSRAEGFPNSLLEAMAYGVPAVAVDCATGPRDIIEPEVNGLLVPQDDPDALRAALSRLMADDTLRAELARQAVTVRERFATNRVAPQWEALLSSRDPGQPTGRRRQGGLP